MPTLKRFGNVRVVLWPNDHMPAHVHVFGPGYAARIGLDDLIVSEESGKPSTAAAMALTWIAENRREIYASWVCLREGR
jgi:hypothetical protein